MKKPAKIETILVFNSSIEMMSFAFFMKNPIFNKIFSGNLKWQLKI